MCQEQKKPPKIVNLIVDLLHFNHTGGSVTRPPAGETKTLGSLQYPAGGWGDGGELPDKYFL